MKRASFFGLEFLSGVAVGVGAVAGALGIMKLHAACTSETTAGPESVEDLETEAAQSPAPEKKPRATRRAKTGGTTARKSSEHEQHRAKSWKN